MRASFAQVFSVVCLAAFLQVSLHAQAAEPVRIDFVADRPFPAEAEKQREFAESFAFTAPGMVAVVTGENEFGGAEALSRRGPGGLGVKGNGDRNSDGKGTTSGNRVNNGEHLILNFTDGDGAPRDVVLVSVEFDRIVRDTENFPDAGPTRYRLLANGTDFPSGELRTDAGAVTVSFDSTDPSPTFRITNDVPFHPIANRFRVAAVTVLLAN